MTTPAEQLAIYSTPSQMSSFFIDKMGIISVKSYGAKGDGVADDTVTVQAAITAAVANGNHELYFPHGSYKLGTLTGYSTLTFIGDNVTMTGTVYTVNSLSSHLADIAKVLISVLAPPSPLVAAKGDGVTDDTAAIVAILSACAGKAICYMPKTSSVYITGGLAIPSNTHLIIDGTLQLKAAANDQILYIPAGNSNILIEGTGTLDGNKANQTANQIACIGGGSVASTNIIINGLQIKNARNWGINLIANKSKILNCVISSCANMSFFGPGSVDVEINGCEVFSITPDWGLGFYGGVTNGILTNCIAHDCAQAGLGVLADVAQPNPSYNIIISNNVSYNNGYAGIVASGGSSDGITICNNIVYGNNSTNLAPTTQSGGINVAGVKHIRIIANTIHGNQSAGIVLSSIVSNIDISGNTFYNELSRGIWTAYATIDRINITNNSFDDNQSTPTMYDCINFQSTTVITNSNISGNYLGRSTSAQKIYLGALSIDYMYNNIGYNPVGILTTPALPATTVTYTNVSGLVCDVYIYGGTVTDISINGTSTGLTSGHFTVSQKQTIAVTYSVAPTWKWFGK